ncbi:MAG: 6-phosphogluconolactonase [Pseudomonadota bacterium]
MTPEIVTYASRAAQAAGLASMLADRLADRVERQGSASIAVPGGKTPGPMLQALGAADLAWDAVTVTLTDERWVPSSSARSNQRLLAETLFAGLAARARFAPLYADAPEPEGGLAAVIDGLAPVLPLDVVVLGMGSDMHTASLFPGADGLAEALAADAPPVVAIRAPGADEPRITLSAPTLRAGERHILIAGEDKRVALDQALGQGDPSRAPILAVLDGATVHYAE